MAIPATDEDKSLYQPDLIANELLLIKKQGGDVEKVVRCGRTADGFGLVINSSRGIIYASKEKDFAEKAALAAQTLRDQIRAAGR